MLSSDVKTWSFQETLLYSREWNSQSFPRRFKASVMSERDCFLLSITVLFDVIIAISSCLDTVVVSTEHQLSDFNACWQRSERTWSILLTGGMKYLPSEVVDKGRKETIMFESSIAVPWKVQFVHKQSTVLHCSQRNVAVYCVLLGLRMVCCYPPRLQCQPNVLRMS